MDSKSMHFKYIDLKSKFKFKFMFLNATLATSKHYMSKKKKKNVTMKWLKLLRANKYGRHSSVFSNVI